MNRDHAPLSTEVVLHGVAPELRVNVSVAHARAAFPDCTWTCSRLPRNGARHLEPERAYAFEYSNAQFIILDSNRLDSSIAEMKAEADWVLFDSPPINFFNDAIILAPRVDGVVMVVEAEKTRWEVARSAKQRIESGNGRILGVILNKRRFHIPGWLYKTL